MTAEPDATPADVGRAGGGTERGARASVSSPRPVSVADAASLDDRESVVDGAGPVDVARRLEAILLVVDTPQSLVALAGAVGAPVAAVRQAVESLVADYDGHAGGPRRGFELREVGGGWRLYVRAEHDDVVAEFTGSQAPARLSQAALETLAVIAYRQPVTRGQVASVRAVNVDSVMRTLVARGLVAELFTDPETGAVHYGTTDALLGHLGINSLDELPPVSPLLDDGADGFPEGTVR